LVAIGAEAGCGGAATTGLIGWVDSGREDANIRNVWVLHGGADHGPANSFPPPIRIDNVGQPHGRPRLDTVDHRLRPL
jgi:hypothetical protein